VSPYIVVEIWNQMAEIGVVPYGVEPGHLLWTLMFLKVYAPEPVLCSLCKCDPKTYRKWVWLLLDGILLLPKVSKSCCVCRYRILISFFF
jgi:hypothetical protein